MTALQDEADRVLARVTTGPQRVPGVVAMVTDRDANVYEGAAGQREVDGEPMTLDTVFALYSATKAVTTTAALQLVEDGALDLDAPVSDYLPGFAELEVLEGFDPSGQPVLRPPAGPATTRQLLTHTSGLGYEFFDDDYARLVRDHGQPRIGRSTHGALTAPLLTDPGTRWQYGIGLDWAGQVIEAVDGRRLGEILADRVFGPLGMTDTAFGVYEQLAPRLARIHVRKGDGTLKPVGAQPRRAELDMGGQGLYGTVGDYLRFIRMWLNEGRGEHGRVLRPETVEFALRDHLPDGLEVTGLPSSDTFLTHDAEFFPGVAKTWSLPFMVNEADAPTGRPAGSQGWAGLANLYYWIDPRNGIGGFWATQVLPFFDPTSVNGFLELETATYRWLAGR